MNATQTKDKKDFLSGLVSFGKAYARGYDAVNTALVEVTFKALFGVDVKGKVPQTFTTLFDAKTEVKKTEVMAPPACGGGKSLACGAATVEVEHEIKPSSDPNARNPFQGTSPDDAKVVGQVLDSCSEVSKGMKKGGLREKNMSIENKSDGTTLIKQAFEYAPQDLKDGAKDLGFDLSDPDTIDGLVDGAKAVGQFFGLWP